MKAFLAPQQRDALIIEHRKERCKKRGDRIKVVLWADEGVTMREIAHRLFISDQTVSEHLAAYKEENARLTPNHKGSHPILSQTESQQLVDHLETVIYTKAKDIQAYVYKTFDKQMSASTILQWLKTN